MNQNNPNNSNNYYYSQPPRPVQMPAYHPGASAAPASTGQGHTEGPPQGQRGGERNLDQISARTGLTPAMIEYIIQQRCLADPAEIPNGKAIVMPWEKIFNGLLEKYRAQMDPKLDAAGLETRYKLFIRPTLTRNECRVKVPVELQRLKRSRNPARSTRISQALPVPELQTGPHGSSQGSQFGRGGAFGAPPLVAGPSSGRSRPAYGDPSTNFQPGSRSGPAGGPQYSQNYQYGAPQQSVRNRSLDEAGTYQQALPIARPQPPWGDRPMPSVGTQRPVLPPMQLHPPPNPRYQGLYDAPATAPVMQHPVREEPVSIYRDSTLNSGNLSQEQFDEAYNFPGPEIDWMLEHGMYLVNRKGQVENFHAKYKEKFGDHRLPSSKRLMQEFHRRRSVLK